MLTHENRTPNLAERTVVIGSAGFIGSAIVRRLRSAGAPVLAISRSDTDLLSPGADAKLAALLRESDAVVCVAAIAPVKTPEMLRQNISLIETLCSALSARPVQHLVNIGSDAIYGDTLDAIDERFDAAPTSLHGIMHLTREILLTAASGTTPFASLRPTLVYGADDPHNGYGPNRFRRLAAEGSPILLFGEGEEQRDHVWVEDVAELTFRILTMRSHGTLNAATGTVLSFKQVAEAVVSHFPDPVPIRCSERSGPMPHNGYRAFDPASTLKAFPGFRYTLPADGFARVHAECSRG